MGQRVGEGKKERERERERRKREREGRMYLLAGTSTLYMTASEASVAFSWPTSRLIICFSEVCASGILKVTYQQY